MKLTTGYKKPIASSGTDALELSSNNSYLLLAGGGHKALSELVSPADLTTELSNYVTTGSNQTITGVKTFTLAINADITGNASYYTLGPSAPYTNVWDCDNPNRIVYSDYGSEGRSVAHAPLGWNFGTLLELGHMNHRGQNSSLNMQLMWDVAHGTTNGGTLWFRGKCSTYKWSKNWCKVLTDQNYSSYALSLSGGMLNGYILCDYKLDNDAYYIWRNSRQKDGEGGRVDNFILLQKADGSFNAKFGTYGNNATDNYIFIGYSNDYNGLNLRIGLSSLTWGDDIILHTGNYNSYAPKLDGTGAKGTWDININGNAATASSVDWDNISGKPTNHVTTDTAQTITGAKTFATDTFTLDGVERSDIKHAAQKTYNWGGYGVLNTTPNCTGMYNSLDFYWYSSIWSIGNLRGSGTDTMGFGIGLKKKDDNDNLYFAPAFRITETESYINNNKIWHAGNDGSESGLDADTLDGNHARAFATAVHTHDYLPFYRLSSADCNTMSQGLTAVRAVSSNQNAGDFSVFLTITDIGTPFQLQIPDDGEAYIYKRYKSGSSWSSWFKMCAGYADSAGNADTVGGYSANDFVKSLIDNTNNFTRFTDKAFFQTSWIKGQGDFGSLVIPTWHGNVDSEYYTTELRFDLDSFNPRIRYTHNNSTSNWRTLALTSDIPTIGNGALHLKVNGTELTPEGGIFTANKSGDSTIDLSNSLATRPELNKLGDKITSINTSIAGLTAATQIKNPFDDSSEGSEESVETNNEPFTNKMGTITLNFWTKVKYTNLPVYSVWVNHVADVVESFGSVSFCYDIVLMIGVPDSIMSSVGFTLGSPKPFFIRGANVSNKVCKFDVRGNGNINTARATVTGGYMNLQCRLKLYGGDSGTGNAIMEEAKNGKFNAYLCLRQTP